MGKKIISKIKPEFINAALKRGGCVAACGAILIILGGTLLPIHLLKLLGIPSFIMGLALIGFGLAPYRRLTRLQLKPNELHDNDAHYLFIESGRPLLVIPHKSLANMKYVEKEREYGLALWLVRPCVEKVQVLDKRFNLEAFIVRSMQQFDGCDLFLPYFCEKDFKDLLESNHAS